MTILDDLLASVSPDGVGLRDVRVGPFWTIVWTDRGAGLASTQHDVHHRLIRWAGGLVDHSTRELAELLRSPSLFAYGVGLIAGTQVIDPPLALMTAGQGAIFRQMGGVRLVTMTKDKK